MTNWLHERRLEAVLAAVRERRAASVLDLGCGDGDLLLRLLDKRHVERILGIDLSASALARLRQRLAARDDEWQTRIELVEGSLMAPRPALAGYDCAVLVETIEHIEPSALGSLERAVFGAMRPKSVIVTTPNAEFNPLLGVPPRRFRHPDHRFEWDRPRFARWARDVAERNGYRHECRDIAGRHPRLGGASQMALFDRDDPR